MVEEGPMSRRAIQRGLWICLSCAGLPGIAGCPLEPPPDEQLAALPAPGTYYVAESGGTLWYLSLAEFRGEPHRWLPLPEGGEWYTAPGFYRLSADGVWSADEESADLTLDELLQLHDPPPVIGGAT